MSPDALLAGSNTFTTEDTGVTQGNTGGSRGKRGKAQRNAHKT
jgi:hypothetical protein